jgi:transposase
MPFITVGQMTGVDPVWWTMISLAGKEYKMPGSHSPYPPEFRQQMVELVRAGRTPQELAAEFEPTAESIRNWVKQAERDEGQRSDGLTTDEKQELARLRRENKQLRLEREILAKATAWFARETGSVPPKSSSS